MALWGKGRAWYHSAGIFLITVVDFTRAMLLTLRNHGGMARRKGGVCVCVFAGDTLIEGLPAWWR